VQSSERKLSGELATDNKHLSNLVSDFDGVNHTFSGHTHCLESSVLAKPSMNAGSALSKRVKKSFGRKTALKVWDFILLTKEITSFVKWIKLMILYCKVYSSE